MGNSFLQAVTFSMSGFHSSRSWLPRNSKPKQEMNLSKEKITALLKGVGDDHKKDVAS